MGRMVDLMRCKIVTVFTKRFIFQIVMPITTLAVKMSGTASL